MSASETWRLELAPLGVRTLTLITGGTKTNFHPNYRLNPPKPIQPENSYYSSVYDVVEGMSDGHLQESGISGEEFAAKVVRELEKGKTGRLWVGGGASAARIVTSFLPDSVLVSYLITSPREITLVVSLHLLTRETGQIHRRYEPNLQQVSERYPRQEHVMQELVEQGFHKLGRRIMLTLERVVI